MELRSPRTPLSDPRVPDDWTVIAETQDGTEAGLVQGRLRDEGIEAVVLESRAAPGAWLTGSQPQWAPKSIAVPASEADRAVELLESDSDGDDLGEEPFTDEYGRDTDAVIGTVSEPFDRRPTMMGGMRVAAWAIAGLVAVSLLFGQCLEIV